MAAIPTSRQAQLTSKIVEAEEAGQKFVDVFYETVDKRRQVESWKAPQPPTPLNIFLIGKHQGV